MSQTAADPIKFDAIPAGLQGLRQWVMWVYEDRHGKPSKIPYQVNRRPAKSNDPNTWSDFGTAKARFANGGFEGVGFVFSKDDPYCGIDLDCCRDPENGTITEWAKEIIVKFGSYAEVSPSLTGVKIFCEGSWPFSNGKKIRLSSDQRVRDRSPAIEGYDSGRYFTLTGWRLQGCDDIRNGQNALHWLKAKYFQPAPHAQHVPNRTSPSIWVNSASEAKSQILKRARAYVAKLDPAISGQGGHDKTFHAACVLVLGFALSVDEAMPLLREYSDRCQPPWSEHELRHKLQSADLQQVSRGYLRDANHHANGTGKHTEHRGKPADEQPLPEDQRGDAWEPNEDRLPGANGEQQATPAPALTIVPFAEFVEQNPTLRAPLIDGLMRQGETMNIIAAPKVGKSWLTLSLAFAVAQGQQWLGFSTTQGRVLLIDNELHKETQADRLRKMAATLSIPHTAIADKIGIVNLRGRLQDLRQLGRGLLKIGRGEYFLIILDAFYRTMPGGTNENDNATMAGLYNELDHYADALQAGFALIHHATKGDQSAKAITDVGAGAGAQSRATDTHLILRPHQEPDAVVLDAAVRSWAPVEPRCLRWRWPLWTVATDLDPAMLRTPKHQRDADGLAGKDRTAETAVVKTLDRLTKRLNMIPSTNTVEVECGVSKTRAIRAVGHLVDEGVLEEVDTTVKTGRNLKVERIVPGLRRKTRSGDSIH
jgi:hypothetical protein